MISINRTTNKQQLVRLIFVFANLFLNVDCYFAKSNNRCLETIDKHFHLCLTKLLINLEL